MKLRLRYQNTTKVLDIAQNLEDSFTVSDLLVGASSLFSSDFSREGHFLSLNKKDPVGESDDKLSVCGLVSGDILHIIQDGQGPSPAKKNENDRPSILGNQRQSTSNSVEQSQPPSEASNKPSVSASNDFGDSNRQREERVYQNQKVNNDEFHDTDIDCNMDVDPDHGEEVNVDVIRQCLSEPVLCREASDGSVPALLKEMVSGMRPEDETEAVCVVLHVLMLETGFLVQMSSKEVPNVPCTWRFPGHYKITYTYTGCPDTQCLLTVIPTGATLTLHGKVTGPETTTWQCSLKVADYVQGDITDCEKCYHQLAKLSRIFKDAVASPLVQDTRTAAGLENIHGILALTQEVKLRIFSFLDVRSLLKLSSVCQETREICDDPYLWRRLYLKDFGNRSDNRLSQNWKQLYKQQYKIRKEKRKLMNRFTPVTPGTWLPHNPFGGPSNWIPPGPGFIGGDYDLYPNLPGLPGIPGRLGPRPPMLPRPRYDLIGPNPDLDPNPEPGLLPRRPSRGRSSGMRNPFSGLGPRFF